jgi:putative endonuclease
VYEHKHGLVSGFTSKYRVSRLVHCEDTDDVAGAIAREQQFKRWLRQKKIALVESVNPKWENLERREGRKIAPGGARSLHCGRDDRKRAGPRPAVPVFFPVREEHPTHNVESPESLLSEGNESSHSFGCAQDKLLCRGGTAASFQARKNPFSDTY